MKISCEEAAIICNKAQYKEASFWERVRLKIHLMYCSHCSQFARMNKKLTSLCALARLRALTGKEKEEIREKVKEKSGTST